MMDLAVGTLVPGLVLCVGDLAPTGGLAVTSVGHPWSLSPHLLCFSSSGTVGLHPLTLCPAGVLCCPPGAWPACLGRAATLPCSVAAAAGTRTRASSRGPNMASSSCTLSGLSTGHTDVPGQSCT